MADKDFDLPGFSAALRLARAEREISWKDLAREAGVSASTLTRVQQGAWPDLRSFSRLCQWLRMPPSAFLAPLPMLLGAAALHSLCRIIRLDESLSEGDRGKIVEIVRNAYKLTGYVP